MPHTYFSCETAIDCREDMAAEGMLRHTLTPTQISIITVHMNKIRHTHTDCCTYLRFHRGGRKGVEPSICLSVVGGQSKRTYSRHPLDDQAGDEYYQGAHAAHCVYLGVSVGKAGCRDACIIITRERAGHERRTERAPIELLVKRGTIHGERALPELVANTPDL